MDDSALLRQYADHHSDEAFAALVTRHVNLVYSVALRQTGNPQNAEEITQAVFIILAKKAAGLRHDKALSSWLFQAARLTAINFVRGEIRRRDREQEAHMQTILNESGGEGWPKIAPLLDDAVAALREKDRRAIVLRFYEGRNLNEVGLALGASEEAAKKRVGRALEKLRQFFAKRGVDSTTAAIAETISTHSVQAAPVMLAKSVTALAVAKGAAASASTLTLIKGALKIMAWTKAKTAAVAGAVSILAAGTTVAVLKNSNHQPVAKPQPAPVVENSTLAPSPPAMAESQQVNDAKRLAVAFLIYTGNHSGRYPKTFDEVKAGGYADNLSIDGWEIVSSGRVNNFTNRSENPRIIMLREKEARSAPDGKYLKVYVFVDGHVEQVASDDNDFAALEKQRGFLVRLNAR